MTEESVSVVNSAAANASPRYAESSQYARPPNARMRSSQRCLRDLTAGRSTAPLIAVRENRALRSRGPLGIEPSRQLPLANAESQRLNRFRGAESARPDGS